LIEQEHLEMPDENVVQNAEAEALKTQLAAAQEQVKATAEAVLATVPDRFRALIPEGDAAAQLAWFAKAKKSGAFEAANVPETDKGKPTITPKGADLSQLPATARIAAGYAKR
jgi:hypothetical protein